MSVSPAGLEAAAVLSEVIGTPPVPPTGPAQDDEGGLPKWAPGLIGAIIVLGAWELLSLIHI